MTKTNLEKLEDSLINKEENNTMVTDHASQKKYLALAITDKISQLQSHLKYLPGLFFSIPGIASERDKSDKIDALQHLQARISDKNHHFDFVNINPDVLDGETLKLFKYAAQIHPYQFTQPEIRSLSNRNPEARISRNICIIPH